MTGFRCVLGRSLAGTSLSSSRNRSYQNHVLSTILEIIRDSESIPSQRAVSIRRCAVFVQSGLFQLNKVLLRVRPDLWVESSSH